MPRRFELTQGTSNKFWEVSVEDRVVTVRWGRIGSDGQSKSKRQVDAATATLVAAKLVGEKEREGYREVASAKTSAKPPSAKAEIAALAKKLAPTEQPYVRIIHKPTKKLLPLWASKACDGRPYVPKSDPWPKVRGGRPLYPVMQIDFADVPALPGFPRKGLLALWWTEDFQDRLLCYYPKPLHDEAKLWTDFSQVPDNTLYPYMKPCALAFEKRTGTITWGDFRFEELVGGEAALHALHDSPNYDRLFDYVWNESGGADTRIGGWANPQQDDPRRGKRAAYTTQLLQIQNDNFTHNLFVKPKDLSRADFSDVLFFDACD